MSKLGLILSIFLGLASAAQAVILGSPDGSANITAPADDPGWNRVGTVNGDSGVYLGDGFVLSAKHVGAGDFTLEGTTYTLDPSYTPQYFQTGAESFADLVIFKIQDAPVMGLLPIWTGNGEINKTATYIGSGLDRGAEVPNQGWLWGGTTTKRWGENVIDGTLTISDPANGFLYSALVSDFDRVTGGTGLANEATGAFGDSGGALFLKQGSVWKLAGIMSAVSQNGHSYYDSDLTLPGDQPDNLYSVRLSAYSSWILTTIPEPNTYAMILIGASALLLRFLRRGKK